MITGKLVSFTESKSGADYVFERTTAAQLSADLERFFQDERYKLEQGTAQDGTYGRGSAALRFLLGGFVPRYKYSIKISDAPNDKIRLEFFKGMSGAMGGVIGARKMRKETGRIIQKLKTSVLSEIPQIIAK
jgi:hypothetical protein